MSGNYAARPIIEAFTPLIRYPLHDKVMLVKLLCTLSATLLRVVAPEKNAGGASTAKVPTASGFQDFKQKNLSYWLKKLKQVMDLMKVPTVHKNLDVDGGAW